jgi:hypothetical protein
MAADLRLSGAQTTWRSECDIRYNYANLNQIIAAANTSGNQAQLYSSDSGATWSQTSLPSAPGDARQSDPAVDWTSDGTAWALTVGIGMTGNAVRCFKSTKPGATWTFDSTVSGTQTNVDKPNLWVDHSPSSPHRDNMYALWWNNAGGNATFVSRRLGPSGTWQAPLQVSGTDTKGSDGGDIKTNSFGDVFAFWPEENAQKLFMAKSTDGGVSFTALGATPVTIADTFASFLYSIPTAQNSRGVLLYISGGAWRTAMEDFAYVVWMDLAGGNGCSSAADEPGNNVNSACKTRIWFSRSVNGGANWSTPAKLNDQPSLNDQFYPRLAVDETSGDLEVVYYDTVNDPARLKTDVWMQSSTDNGQSWSAAQLVTSAETDETSAGANINQRGDYIGLTGYAGQFFACWTDRRSGGFEEIWGASLPLVQRAVTFQIHRDHYGQDEVDAARKLGAPVIKTGFWLAVDGFTARELGITGPGSTNLAPPPFFNPSTGVSASCTSLDSTDPSFSPDTLARFRFGYDVNFGPDDSAFTSFAGQTEPVTLTAGAFQGITPSPAQVTFMKQPDPYILQGPQTWWLSNDIRLVQVAQGDSAFSITMGTDPVAFLQQVTAALEVGQGMAGGQTFDANTTEDNEVISVAPQTLRGGNLVNVYNFALARVHYQGLAQPASDVRVFFRLFAANSTATDFHPDTTYSRDPATYPVLPANFGQHTTPTPGVIANEYVSVPCFGAARQDPTQAGAPNSLPQLQFDTPNDRNLPATGGPIKDFYYGCFLDINGNGESTPTVLPPTPPAGNANGPWPPNSGVTLEPLRQAFIRNDHQCLVAEIAFDPDPINAGTQPWNSDKLAQRNISWSYAANPGVDVSRGAIETFEVRPTPKASAADPPDEIMIDWLNVPTDQLAQIYLPAVSADEVLARASRLYPTHRLSRIDAATIGCLTGGVTYIPLPEGSGDGANFAGLMQISLPAGIRRGQLYQVVVRQLTNAFGEAAPPPPPPPQVTAAVNQPPLLRWRKVLGTFQINIPVSTKELLLGREELRLSIFRWIAEGIPHYSRWWPVFRRYLELIAIRVSELGGDPTQIKPSPNGYGGLPSPLPRPEEPHRLHEYTGKVEALIYDHFGDFDGFMLELHDGATRRFDSREGEIEELVREAWEDRIVTTVVVSTEHRHRPLSILLKRSSGWRSR